MKTIGIIGGMSFESTLDYYRIINEKINQKLGGLHSAKMLIESYDFAEIEKLQSKGDWASLTKTLTNTAKKLEDNGADYIAIATNTMHIMADEVQSKISMPLIHITDATAKQIKNKNIDTVALFGTRYTMNKGFYKDRLKEKFGINVIIPEENEQTEINDIIYQELCKGIFLDSSRDKLTQIMKNCVNRGAKSVILGCTELPCIIKDSKIDVINTTEAHCIEIVEKIIG